MSSSALRDAKVRQLKANQQRWMEERQRANDIVQLRRGGSGGGVGLPCSDAPKNDDCDGNNFTSGQGHKESLSDDLLLNKLTEKISSRLRDELMADMRKSSALTGKESADLAVSMENYLSGELRTHQCQICFELMTPPLHTPTLLFPCGHTFCVTCVRKNEEKGRGPEGAKCPYCRNVITSSAVNHSLKDLIERFADQKGKLESNAVEHLDDIFPQERKGDGERAGSRSCPPSPSSLSRDSKRYLASYQSCAMRRKILQNELEDSKSELQKIIRRKVAVGSMKDLLQRERLQAEEKRARVEEELELVSKHLIEQEEKERSVRDEEIEMISRVNLVQKTIDGVSDEMEKCKLLALGSDPDLSRHEELFRPDAK